MIENDDKKMWAAFAMHALINRSTTTDPDAIPGMAWKFADRMQEEADKRAAIARGKERR